MAYNNEPVPPNRNTGRIALGLIMIGFSLYRLIVLLRDLPLLFENGDSTQIFAYCAVPALIVVVFFFGGLRVARQGYYGTEKAKREE